MPNFSTTEGTDRAVTAVVIIGTIQRYFEYIIVRGYEFPLVTLLEEKRD